MRSQPVTSSSCCTTSSYDFIRFASTIPLSLSLPPTSKNTTSYHYRVKTDPSATMCRERTSACMQCESNYIWKHYCKDADTSDPSHFLTCKGTPHGRGPAACPTCRESNCLESRYERRLRIEDMRRWYQFQSHINMKERERENPSDSPPTTTAGQRQTFSNDPLSQSQHFQLDTDPRPRYDDHYPSRDTRFEAVSPHSHHSRPRDTYFPPYDNFTAYGRFPEALNARSGYYAANHYHWGEPHLPQYGDTYGWMYAQTRATNPRSPRSYANAFEPYSFNPQSYHNDSSRR